MDTGFYNEFITIVESKNFAEAADKLASSTSALSRHLHAAEEELGVELFIRTSRGVQLNEYGELFLQHAKKMRSQIDDFANTLKKRVEYSKNTVFYSGNYQSNLFLAPFKQKYPQYHLKQVTTQKSAVNNLLDRVCEIAISLSPSGVPDGELITSKRLGSDSLIVAINVNHPMAKKESIKLSELRNEPFIAILSRETSLPMNEDVFERAGFEPNIAFSCSTGEEALVLVSQGFGAAIMMKELAKQSANSYVHLIEIEGEKPLPLFICRRKDEKLSPAAQALWDFVKPLE